MIGAVGHGAGIAPGDASAVGGGIVSTSVDFPQVSAALDHALIAPGNAAAVGVSGDRGPVGAAPHHAGAPVDAYQCAHVLISRHIASDGDLFHCAVVLTGQDAHLRLGAARGHYPVQNQIFYDSPLAQRAEQAYLGTLSSQAKPEMVCPAPSKVPRNTGMVEKPVPAREMSAASTTVTP